MPESRPLTSKHTFSGAQFGLVGRGAQRQQALIYARACWPDGTEPEQQLLALHLAAILALDDTLESGQPLFSAGEEQRTLLPWSGTPSSLEGVEAFSSRRPIRAALAQVEAGLASTSPTRQSILVPRLPDEPCPCESAIEWWRKQGELMIAAVWEECRWRNSRTFPDETSYLAVAEVSIGVWWIVASLLLLDGARTALLAGSPVLTATAAVAAAIRVANDLHDTRRERREGKVQLLFLRTRALQALGYPARSAQRRARQELHAALMERVARARGLLDGRRWAGSPRLRSGLAGMLSAALDLIHAQEQVVPDTGAASGEPRW
jgi:hypothetical protein